MFTLLFTLVAYAVNPAYAAPVFIALLAWQLFVES